VARACVQQKAPLGLWGLYSTLGAFILWTHVRFPVCRVPGIVELYFVF